ncbi:MAG: hypothetical protein NTV70_23415 [Acidobacteria bacterium]|nr:hypothetical protein [Acidobacteriota bacterium]
MPIGPLIFFIIFAVIVALVFAMAFMPPNKLVEKIDRKKKP